MNLKQTLADAKTQMSMLEIRHIAYTKNRQDAKRGNSQLK